MAKLIDCVIRQLAKLFIGQRRRNPIAREPGARRQEPGARRQETGARSQVMGQAAAYCQATTRWSGTCRISFVLV